MLGPVQIGQRILVLTSSSSPIIYSTFWFMDAPRHILKAPEVVFAIFYFVGCTTLLWRYFIPLMYVLLFSFPFDLVAWWVAANAACFGESWIFCFNASTSFKFLLLILLTLDVRGKYSVWLWIKITRSWDYFVLGNFPEPTAWIAQQWLLSPWLPVPSCAQYDWKIFCLAQWSSW